MSFPYVHKRTVPVHHSWAFKLEVFEVGDLEGGKVFLASIPCYLLLFTLEAIRFIPHPCDQDDRWQFQRGIAQHLFSNVEPQGLYGWIKLPHFLADEPA